LPSTKYAQLSGGVHVVYAGITNFTLSPVGIGIIFFHDTTTYQAVWICQDIIYIGKKGKDSME